MSIQDFSIIESTLREGEQDELLVDLAALKMVSEPQGFDVLVTTNMFGDILSDAAAHWCGGLGMAPSLNWGAGMAVAEPGHGSAPALAGRGVGPLTWLARMHRAEVSVNAVLNQLSTVFIFILAAVVLREPVTTRRVLALALALAGALLVILR